MLGLFVFGTLIVFVRLLTLKIYHYEKQDF
ncbi:hypothetical protein SAMN05216480_10825 [Pustulibacterium marinum]|uniref:Uncharacterized protein n=1 Tax=Pustulibacterium marinum TaxID=1224947 RepID=A0A1I7H9X4_9FLAO|nr:hypothetical protein SAMN05216480_10825 [Pustulibacterium marinum]